MSLALTDAATVSPEQLIDTLHWRYATKKYDPQRTIPEATWNALLESLVLSPSSYGLQPWKFFVVENPEVREKLKAASWNQSQVTEAAQYVVLAHRTDLKPTDVERYIERIAEVRQTTPASLDGFKKLLDSFIGQAGKGFDEKAWSARQTYIALGMFLASAALLGVDTTPMEGFDPAKYDEILKLKEQGYHAVVAVAAGYRANDDAYAGLPKVRYETQDVVAHI